MNSATYSFQETDDVLLYSAEDMKDVFFLKLAQKAGSHWAEIGVYLDMDYDSLPSEGDTVKCAMQVFMRWRQSGGKTLRDLHRALLEAQQGSMAYFVVQKARGYRLGMPWTFR